MIKHKEMTVDKILIQLLGVPEGLTRERNGIQEPVSDSERAAVLKQVLESSSAGQIRFLCVGCGEPKTPSSMECCECGGFVCDSCRRIEEEGACDHEFPL